MTALNLILVLIGVFGWILLHLASTKDRYDTDKSNKKFSFKKYADKSWDNWLFAATGGIIFYFGFPLLFPLLWWLFYAVLRGQDPVPEIPFDLSDSQVYAATCGFFGGLVLQKLYRALKRFTGNGTY